MTNKTFTTMRLAMRVEGDMWNAYYAHPDTMDGAHLLGSIHMGIVTKSPEIKSRFIDLMRSSFSHLTRATFGSDPEWDEAGMIPAPEHERAGNA